MTIMWDQTAWVGILALTSASCVPGASYLTSLCPVVFGLWNDDNVNITSLGGQDGRTCKATSTLPNTDKLSMMKILLSFLFTAYYLVNSIVLFTANCT